MSTDYIRATLQINCLGLSNSHTCITNWEKQVITYVYHHMRVLWLWVWDQVASITPTRVITIYTCLTTRNSPLSLLYASVHLFRSFGNLPPPLLAWTGASASPQRPEIQGPIKPLIKVISSPLSFEVLKAKGIFLMNTLCLFGSHNSLLRYPGAPVCVVVWTAHVSLWAL